MKPKETGRGNLGEALAAPLAQDNGDLPDWREANNGLGGGGGWYAAHESPPTASRR